VKAEAVKFLWKRKHLTFWRAGTRSIFHKTWGRDVEVEAGRGSKLGSD